MIRFLILLVACAGLGSLSASKPDIVFFLADDLGYGDIGCYGCPDAKTPNIDRIAKEGVKFTQFYANGQECTPTRTALLTGRYQQRAGGLECAIGTGNVGRYDDAIRLAEANDLGLPVKMAVLPGGLKEAGYRAGIFGKWHLGYEKKFNPLNYGWDAFFGVLGGNCHYFTHEELSPLPVVYEGRKPVKREGYMTHLIADSALAFLKESDEKPMFLYVPFTAPHFPFHGPDEAALKFTAENWTKGTRASYVKMIEDMDVQIGRILKALPRPEDTLVLFASDHGAMKPGYNTPLNGYKGGLFEGGVRAPLVARWPGKIKAGTVSDQPAMMMDLTASFLRIAGSSRKRPLDGIDILHHVEAGAGDFLRTLFWRGRRGDRTWKAVRDGTMKYLWKTEGGKEEEWFFDLAKDPGEKNNLLERRADDAAKLKKKLAAWEAEVQALR